MFPVSAGNDSSDMACVQAVDRGYSVECLAFAAELANAEHVRFGDPAAAVGFAANLRCFGVERLVPERVISVLGVLGLGADFQIGGGGILLIAVLVVDLPARRDWPEKSGCDQGVDAPDMLSPAGAEVDVRVTSPIQGGPQNLSGLGSRCWLDPAYAAKVAHLINTFKADNGLPLFHVKALNFGAFILCHRQSDGEPAAGATSGVSAMGAAVPNGR